MKGGISDSLRLVENIGKSYKGRDLRLIKVSGKYRKVLVENIGKS